jgi:hypothetical protein
MEMKKDRILLSDGRRGHQIRWRPSTEDGWRLLEVVITEEANGRRCRHCYAAKSDLQAFVFSFADLGNVTWQIVV